MQGALAGIGLTHLTVYEHSGCAHVHAVTDEAYYVIAGTGAVELHDLDHGFRSVALSPGSFVQFTPGTLHRSVNHCGLTVLALMSNAGLAERGDARIWFGPQVDADPAGYDALVRLREQGLAGALERRDRSVAAYMELMRLWAEDRAAYRAELKRFIDLHARAMAPLRERFAQVVRHGPAAWLETAVTRIGALPQLSGAAEATSIGAAPGEQKLGMCGLLRPLDITEPV
jgi:mannose-6-phosphate isomerase-like protein (cupin superfamily)